MKIEDIIQFKERLNLMHRDEIELWLRTRGVKFSQWASTEDLKALCVDVFFLSDNEEHEAS